MFTGIIEDIGLVSQIEKDNDNLNISIQSKLAPELKIDQSVSHNGICLTVVAKSKDNYMVTAIKETILKSNVKNLKIGDKVNLERGIKLGDRLDGHIVQGHIDQIGVCTEKEYVEGSWYFSFEYDASLKNVTIEKGSITVNGVSLTVVNSEINAFQVAIIPYTYEHTNFHSIEKGTMVNLEFDVIGKYLRKLYTNK